MSALAKLKAEKSISNLESHNPSHPLAGAVDAIPAGVEL
tara:strand:+ start:484 stop:600 length:117 start_codon:yes stop_codon:yes gene_type:complete